MSNHNNKSTSCCISVVVLSTPLVCLQVSSQRVYTEYQASVSWLKMSNWLLTEVSAADKPSSSVFEVNPCSNKSSYLFLSIKYQYNPPEEFFEGSRTFILHPNPELSSSQKATDSSCFPLRRRRKSWYFLKFLRGHQHHHRSPQTLLQRAAYTPHHIWCLPTLHRNRK